MPERKCRQGLTGRELPEGTGENKCNFTPPGAQWEESSKHPSLPVLPGHRTPAQGNGAASVCGTLTS